MSFAILPTLVATVGCDMGAESQVIPVVQPDDTTRSDDERDYINAAGGLGG